MNTDPTNKDAKTLLERSDLKRRWSIGETSLRIVMKSDDFPAPFILPGMGIQRGRRWRLDDIVSFENNHRTEESGKEAA